MRRLRIITKRRNYTEEELAKMYRYWDIIRAELAAQSSEPAVSELKQEVQSEVTRLDLQARTGPVTWEQFASMIRRNR
jgi:hypothetical protein